MVGGEPKSLLDVLAFAERLGWVENAEEFIGARKLRNLLVPEYMTDSDLFLEALLIANSATELLFRIVEKLEREAERVGLLQSNGACE